MIGAPSFPDVSALIADESVHLRRIVREMLGRVGIRRVIEASDGAEAIGALGDARPDLVILDWGLSILSGEEFVRLARTLETSPAPTVPIILMLTEPRRPVIDQAIELGVNEIIRKPFSPKTLWSRLDEVLNRPRPFVRRKGLLRPVARAASAGEAA